MVSDPGKVRAIPETCELADSGWNPHHPVVIDVIEGDLLPMHVETAYHCRRDLLELLKNFSGAHIIERLSRGGPHHMSSLSWFLSGVGALDAQGGGGVADMSLLLLWLRKTWLPLPRWTLRPLIES